ncbi:MAG: Sfum_1244 family protein [Betaproteobacteria bacterium]
MMRFFPQLASAVQHNCDISDARYAGDYGLCTFLLKMREYYRWENELPFARSLSKDELGEWIGAREQNWDGIETEEFAPLPLAQGELDPFDADAANRELMTHGCVYGAGYGRFHKPVFFLGRLLRVEERAGFRIIVSSCEYARELAAPPATLQGRTIFLRQESVCRYLWEKIEEWQWNKQGDAMARALAGYDFIADTDAALQRMADNAMETMILHELGEAAAGDLLGEAWSEMAASVARTRAEPVVRAVRDLLADCLSTLPALLERANLPALHFYFATFDAPRRQLFPQALEAYEHFLRYGTLEQPWRIVREGKERWLDAARALLTADEAGRAAAIEALLGDGSAAPGRPVTS